MSTTSYLKDAAGRSFRMLIEDCEKVTIKTVGGQTLGWYDKRTGTTHNASGRMLGYGNTVCSL